MMSVRRFFISILPTEKDVMAVAILHGRKAIVKTILSVYQNVGSLFFFFTISALIWKRKMSPPYCGLYTLAFFFFVIPELSTGLMTCIYLPVPGLISAI